MLADLLLEDAVTRIEGPLLFARREARVGRKPRAKRWPDEQEPDEANAWGEEADISKARHLPGTCGRRSGRHKREGRCVIPGEICGIARESQRRRKASRQLRRSQPRS